MGNPMSPVLANIFMTKLEADKITLYNPWEALRSLRGWLLFPMFYKQTRWTSQPAQFTVEEDPDHFLDGIHILKNDKFLCALHRKLGKMPTHRKSDVPAQWKRSCIIGDLPTELNASLLILTNIRYRYICNRWLFQGSVISYTVNSFIEKQKEEILIPHFFFDEA